MKIFERFGLERRWPTLLGSLGGVAVGASIFLPQIKYELSPANLGVAAGLTLALGFVIGSAATAVEVMVEDKHDQAETIQEEAP